MTAWPAGAKIVADGYSVRDEARTLRTSLEGGQPDQLQPQSAAGSLALFCLRGVSFLLAGDSELNIAQTWFIDHSNEWFDWSDPEDGVTRPARVRGGAATISYTATVVDGHRTWSGECEVEGWRYTPDVSDPPTALWPAIAPVVADGFVSVDEIYARRVQFDDGAWRQVRPFSGHLRRRDIAFRLASDTDLIRFRKWAYKVGNNHFTFYDPTDGQGRKVRVRGGIEGLQYTAEVIAGRRTWAGQCTLEGAV